MLKLTFALQDEKISVQLATPSYPAGELLTFAGGAITIGALSVATVKNLVVSANLGTTAIADRRFVNAGGLPQEPLQNAMADIRYSAQVEFENMTLYNRYLSATAAGTMAQLIATWTGPTLVGASTAASLKITLPNARHDGETPNVQGPQLLTLNLQGPALNTNGGSDDAITLVYATADSTA